MAACKRPEAVYISSVFSNEASVPVAQLGEHLPYKQEVIGSSPIVPTTFFIGLVAQLVRALACHARGRGFEPLPGRHFYFKSGLFFYMPI